ncbi:unnamed protein product [Closterium sp. Naga37s-1]|nr:unnamed protein product [Closterium sp. Naga37s-1]
MRRFVGRRSEWHCCVSRSFETLSGIPRGTKRDGCVTTSHHRRLRPGGGQDGGDPRDGQGAEPGDDDHASRQGAQARRGKRGHRAQEGHAADRQKHHGPANHVRATAEQGSARLRVQPAQGAAPQREGAGGHQG